MAIGGFNLLGIVITGVLILLFLVAFYFYTQFFQIISYKIRIILKNTVSKGADFKSLYFPLQEDASKTEMYNKLEKVYKREVIKRKNFYFKNIFFLMIERFHHLFYLAWRHKILDKLILLRPPTSFYYMTYLANLIFLWSISILIVSVQNTNDTTVSATQAVGWSIIVAFSGSLVTFIVTYFAHRYYAKEVKRVFYKEMEEEQDRLFKDVFVGKLVDVKDDTLISLENDAQGSSKLPDQDNHTEISMKMRTGAFSDTKPIYKGWMNREQYRVNALQHKNTLKELSILQLHSKRLNVLEECRTLKLYYASQYDPIKQSGNYFCGNTLGKTPWTFFTSDKCAIYGVEVEKKSHGDQELFVSEMKRSNVSKVNWIHLVLVPFL